MKHPAPLAAMACLLLSSAILAGGGVITFSGRIVEAQCPMSPALRRATMPQPVASGQMQGALHLEALLANGKTLPLQAKADARSSSQPSANGLDLDRSERSRSFSIATPRTASAANWWSAITERRTQQSLPEGRLPRPFPPRQCIKPSSCELGCNGRLAVSYFHMANATLSSALRRFTVLFGMGRRGTTSLWPPDINWYKLKEAWVGVHHPHIFGIQLCRTTLSRRSVSQATQMIGSSLTSN